MNEETRNALSKVIDEHKKKYATKMAQAKRDREAYQASHPTTKEERVYSDSIYDQRDKNRKRKNWNE